MLKSFLIFNKNGVHLLEKMTFVKKQGLSALNMQRHFLFMLSYEHVNFAINGKYSKKIMIIQTIMLPL
jgi:hypothetical protein